MSKVQLLTQDRCPKCVALKNFLEKGLRNKYSDDVVEVKREIDRQEFMALVEKHGIMATPVLIYEDQVLVDTTPSKVTDFLSTTIG